MSDKKSHKLSEMIGFLVLQSTEGVHVELQKRDGKLKIRILETRKWISDLDLVPWAELGDDSLGGHAVPVVVDVVLVVQGPDLLAILPDGHENLLHVLGADRDAEHVAA